MLGAFSSLQNLWWMDVHPSKNGKYGKYIYIWRHIQFKDIFTAPNKKSWWCWPMTSLKFTHKVQRGAPNIANEVGL